jgi:hypothetical protein
MENGVNFYYINHKGDMWVPTARTRNRKQKAQLKKQKEIKKRKEDGLPYSEADLPYSLDDYSGDETTITYTEFDEYEAELSKIGADLIEMAGLVTPITEGLNPREISELVASSDNVLPFRKPVPKT